MSHEADVTGWVARIETEYREMPGLRLTERQMQRLWGLDRTTCAAAVSALVSHGVLVKTNRDTYARADRRDPIESVSAPLKKEHMVMNTQRTHSNKRIIRTTGAVLAVALLVAAGAWRGFAAGTQVSAFQASEPPSLQSRVSEPGRHDSYADIVKVVAPAVVTIRTEGRMQASAVSASDDDFLRRYFGDQFGGTPGQPRAFKQRGLGSGVIVGADGYILTNHHVVDGADSIRVDLIDGRALAARVIGSDSPSDLALLKIDATKLHALALGDSNAVQVGEVVLAVGNPLGVGQTVTMGIVSAKGRSTGLGDGGYEDFLQTDAPINQGNSGGALVNTRGELIGINSQILSTSGGNIGIGFAIPANMARHVMTVLRVDGRVRRGQLGVTAQSVTSDLAASLGLKQVSGAIVSSVKPGSAADRGGVKRGDVITSFNGYPVPNANTLRNRVADTTPGARASLVVIRDGTERQLTVQVDEAASQVARNVKESIDENDANLGVTVVPATPELAAPIGQPSGVRGLMVEQVSVDSRAADAGLQPGDVIQEVNRHPVLTAQELRMAVHQASDRPLLLLVNRSGQELFLTASAS